jgi:hypothetical protein
MNHQCTQISIAAFADAEQAGSPSAGSLLRHQAKPSRELTAVREAASIAHGGDQGCCRHGADAFDLAKPLALLVGAEDFPYPPVIGCNAGIKLCQLRLQFPHERSDHLADTVVDVSHDDSKAAPELRDVTCNDNPMLGQKTTNLVDEPDPVGDQTPANAMDGLHRKLIG